MFIHSERTVGTLVWNYSTNSIEQAQTFNERITNSSRNKLKTVMNIIHGLLLLFKTINKINKNNPFEEQNGYNFQM